MKILLFFVLLTVPSVTYASNLLRAIEFFQKLDKNHLDTVDQFYDKNVAFQDPVHKLTGSDAVKSYYRGQYNNVDSIRFENLKTLSQGNTVVLEWIMYLKSPSINSGNEISVAGTSVMVFDRADGKVTYHRDYFDMGEFVYERIPVLKTVVRMIKSKLANAK